jgi:hypothetical protein
MNLYTYTLICTYVYVYVYRWATGRAGRWSGQGACLMSAWFAPRHQNAMDLDVLQDGRLDA